MKNRKRELHDQLLSFIDENGPTTKRGIRLAFGTKSEAQINFIKSNWMKGFSLGKKATEADIVRAEAIMSIRAFQNKRAYR
jgi:hypothetical protein